MFFHHVAGGYEKVYPKSVNIFRGLIFAFDIVFQIKCPAFIVTCGLAFLTTITTHTTTTLTQTTRTTTTTIATIPTIGLCA